MKFLKIMVISLSLCSCASQSIESSAANEKQALGLSQTHQVQPDGRFSEGLVSGIAFGMGQAASFLLIGMLIAL